MPQEDISGEDLLSCWLSKLGVPRPRVVLVDSGCGDRLRSRLVEKCRYLVVGCSVPESDIWFDATWTSASSAVLFGYKDR